MAGGVIDSQGNLRREPTRSADDDRYPHDSIQRRPLPNTPLGVKILLLLSFGFVVFRIFVPDPNINDQVKRPDEGPFDAIMPGSRRRSSSVRHPVQQEGKHQIDPRSLAKKLRPPTVGRDTAAAPSLAVLPDLAAGSRPSEDRCRACARQVSRKGLSLELLPSAVIQRGDRLLSWRSEAVDRSRNSNIPMVTVTGKIPVLTATARTANGVTECIPKYTVFRGGGGQDRSQHSALILHDSGKWSQTAVSWEFVYHLNDDDKSSPVTPLHLFHVPRDTQPGKSKADLSWDGGLGMALPTCRDRPALCSGQGSKWHHAVLQFDPEKNRKRVIVDNFVDDAAWQDMTHHPAIRDGSRDGLRTRIARGACTQVWAIGGDTVTGKNPAFVGEIASVRLYNRLLSRRDIARQYRAFQCYAGHGAPSYRGTSRPS